MITTKSASTFGSESCHPMISSNSKDISQQEQINDFRQSFVGNTFLLTFTDTALGIAVFQRVTADNKIHMAGFSGRRKKPDFIYSFRSLERADIYRSEWHQKLVSNAAFKAEKARIGKQPQTMLVVGYVLVAVWGYDQTNYSYFQVTRLPGKRTVEIREVSQKKQEIARLQGICAPVKNNFIGEPMIKRVDADGGVQINKYIYATKKESIVVEGVEIFRPDHYTAYA